MKKLFSLLLALCLLLGSAALAEAAVESPAASEQKSEFLWYLHDPQENPKAMEDIVADPDAIYGFRPSEEGSLAQYADADWTDPAVVEAGRQDRLAYHESIEDMYVMFNDMKAEGKTTEEIARAVSARRNEIRLEAYADDPEGLAEVKARNLEKYGHEEGPLADELYEKYGSWQKVLESAFTTNSGMDACLGLYDDYFDLYVASGQVEPDNGPSQADREAYEQLLADNSWESINSRHAAKTSLDAYYQDGEVTVEFGRRVDGDSDYRFSEAYESLALSDYYLEQNLENDLPLYVMLYRPGENASAIEEAQESIALNLVEGEDLVCLREEEDAWLVVTETDDSDIAEILIGNVNEFRAEGNALTWQEGAKLRFYMAFDKASGDDLVNYSYLCAPDGSVTRMQMETYEYDTPAEFDKGLLADWFHGEDIREMTVVFDADTDRPETVAYAIPRGILFDIRLNDAFPAVYTDEAMTEEMDYKAAAEMDAATLYLRADGT